MPPVDFASIKSALLASGDSVVTEVARHLAEVFDKSTRRPPAALLERRDEIAEVVRRWFPIRFTDTFQNWIQQDRNFAASLAAGDDLQVAQAYRNAFDAIWQTWLRIVHFFPFILMVSINRLRREDLTRNAAEELASALHHYDLFYQPAGSREQKEADQRDLLISLLRLFRTFSKKSKLGDEYFFRPLLTEGRDFSALLPERFDAELLLFQQIRNRNIHGNLGNRKREVLAPIYQLLVWCFLDVVSLLQPIWEAFELVYITRIEVTPEQTSAEGLSLSCSPGPAPVRYLLPAGFKSDINKVSEDQLYIVARAKKLRDGTPAEFLEPRDYLDLTPFLIFEYQHRRRTQEEDSEAPGARQQQRYLFVLNEAAEQTRLLKFLEFAGAFDRTIPERLARLRTVSKSGTAGQPPAASLDAASSGVDIEEQLEADRLLEEIQVFRKAAALLADMVPKSSHEPVRPVTLDLVREKLWSVSGEHLTAILPVAQFNAKGQRVPGVAQSVSKTAFLPELFVLPSEASDLDSFFESDQRGLVLTGPSGSGKSALLAHCYLRQLQAGGPCLFLTGRLIPHSNIETLLEETAISRIGRNWRLSDFNEFLKENGRAFTLIVDAVNEHYGPGGPLELLGKLIRYVKETSLADNLRLVLSVRSETWFQYCELVGSERLLDKSLFHPSSGEPASLDNFNSEELRRQLYSKYQAYFELRPERYESLRQSERELIRRPFMMSLVAETYSNRAELGKQEQSGKSSRRIPANLNYFEIFSSLTERKAQDAKSLFPPGDPVADGVPKFLKTCLVQFAGLLYMRLTAGSTLLDTPSAALASGLQLPARDCELRPTDTLPWDMVYKSVYFQQFLTPLGSFTRLSPFTIALQLGLIERTYIPELDEWGNETQGRAFKFFHDQYAQYSLSAIYNKDVLGLISTQFLQSPEATTRLSGKISELIDHSINAPVLAGALDHWYHANMRRAPQGDLLLPLLNELARSGTGGVRYWVSSLLANLVLRDIVPSNVLSTAVFTSGNTSLRLCLASAFDEFWPDLDSSALMALLDACDKDRDNSLLVRLADIFALRFAEQPDETLNYVDLALLPASGYLDLVTVQRQNERFTRHVIFAVTFALTCIRAHVAHPELVGKIRKFLFGKYHLLIESLIEERGAFSLKSVVRANIYKSLEATGVDIWENAIGSQNGNNAFFVEQNGVCQRDILWEFFPHAAAMHNADPSFSIAPGSPFRELALRMLTYEVSSVNGYMALVLVPFALRHDWQLAESFILAVLSRDTPAARFFGILLMVNLTYTEPAFAEPSLDLMYDKLLPSILAKGQEAGWLTLHCMGIVDNDVARYWPKAERILRVIFDDFTSRSEEAQIAKFGDELLRSSFFIDPSLGVRVSSLLLDLGYLENPLWRRCTVKVLAGLLSRNTGGLRQLLRERDIPESVLRETRSNLTESVLMERDLFGNQVSWNSFCGHAMREDIALRYFIITIMVGGIVQANSAREYAKEFRRFLVAMVRLYYGKGADAEKYRHIDVAKALEECEHRRRVGGGELYVPRNPVAAPAPPNNVQP